MVKVTIFSHYCCHFPTIFNVVSNQSKFVIFKLHLLCLVPRSYKSLEKSYIVVD